MFRYFVFLILAFASTSSFAALPKKMCFESYPRTTYDINGVHNWTINEIIVSPTAYKVYQLVVVSQVKDNSGFYNFTFGGHTRNNSKETVPVAGVGYQYDGKYKIELQSSFVRSPTDQELSSQIYPAVNLYAFWDMYTMTGPVPSSSVEFTNIPNNNLLNKPINNVYEVSIVRPIPCDQYNRTAPSNY